jgi:hypothetical protein
VLFTTSGILLRAGRSPRSNRRSYESGVQSKGKADAYLDTSSHAAERKGREGNLLKNGKRAYRIPKEATDDEDVKRD